MTTKRVGGEEKIDGWYIDHEPEDKNCAPDFVRTEPLYVLSTGLVMRPELPQFRHTGPLPTGLAVQLIRTVRYTTASTPAVMVEEVVEDLIDSDLEASTFDLPAGLTKNLRPFRGK
jgi:hypothetical protein